MERSFETITESLVNLSNYPLQSSLTRRSYEDQTRFSLLLVLTAITALVIVSSWYWFQDPILVCEEGLKTWLKVVSGCEALTGAIGVAQFLVEKRTTRVVCWMAAVGIPGVLVEFVADLFGIMLLHLSSSCSLSFWYFCLFILVLSFSKLWFHSVYVSLILCRDSDILCNDLSFICAQNFTRECAECSTELDADTEIVSFGCRRQHRFHRECIRRRTVDGEEDACPICVRREVDV